MYHFFEAVTNSKGASLPGYFGRLIDPTSGAVVSIYADSASTPILTASGVVNMAKTDDVGNLSLYVAPGTYHLDIYGADAQTFVYRVSNIAMTATQGIQGVTGTPGPADNTYTDLPTFKASSIASTTAQLVGVSGVPNGRFNWETNNTPYTADDLNIIKADSTALSIGAWIRQQSSGVTFKAAASAAILRSSQDKHRDTVSVKDFGAKGDGSTDDTAAIQAALNCGASKIAFPKGVYKTGALTLPDWIHIEGEGYQPGIPGAGAVTLSFAQTGSTPALACGANPVIRNFVFLNTGGSYNDTTKTLSGTATPAIGLTANATVKECTFTNWYIAVQTGAASYYVKTSMLEFNRCTYGYKASGASPYNLHIDAPISRDTAIFLAGDATYQFRNVKIMGGSIEGYTAVAQYFTELSCFGTYFESISQRDGCYAIDPKVNGSCVSLYGCLVFLNYTARWVNLAGLTNATLTSVGNNYDGVGRAAGIVHYLPSTGACTLTGDRFGSSHPNDCLYVDSIASAGRFNVTLPLLPASNTQATFSGVTVLGPKGFTMAAVTAAPITPGTGQWSFADGVTWDPLSRAAGRPYYVIWQGDRWRSPDGGA